jgi:Fe-Mn family superoxide dismutase
MANWPPQITNSFNSFDGFKTAFTDAGKNRFGSGWAMVGCR